MNLPQIEKLDYANFSLYEPLRLLGLRGLRTPRVCRVCPSCVPFYHAVSLLAICQLSQFMNFLRSDPCCSIEEISKYTEISSGSIYRILKEDLGVSKVCAQWVLYHFRRPRLKIA